MMLRISSLLSSLKRARSPSYILLWLVALSSLTVFVLYQVDQFAGRTKTVAGHNLEPTPWHPFPQRTFNDESRQSRAYKIIQCSYLSCPYASNESIAGGPMFQDASATKCPDFFGFIHRDLEPWFKTRVTREHIRRAKDLTAFRVVISKGKLYLDIYYDCVQSRMMFTIWGLLQLLKRYPGMVPDVDMMFDCMDKPTVGRDKHESFPLPLFRYCTTEQHFDIPFPDWSFWGWPEVNLRQWEVEFQDIKKGSQGQSWLKKWPRAFWKGNPYVESPVREQLLQCNHSRKWGAQIMKQDWEQEAKAGYEKSKLSNQCDYRYKIYAEGYAWSVSLKYIVACGSVSLIICPQYEDFFSRGLVPKENYWPVSTDELCNSIKFAVDWGNSHLSEAHEIGKRGQDFMGSLNMDRVYDYMFHLIVEYSKLLDFKPVPPNSALEVCPESLLCLADPKQKEFLEASRAIPSPNLPCSLKPGSSDFIEMWMQRKRKAVDDVRAMERPQA